MSNKRKLVPVPRLITPDGRVIDSHHATAAERDRWVKKNKLAKMTEWMDTALKARLPGWQYRGLSGRFKHIIKFLAGAKFYPSAPTGDPEDDDYVILTIRGKRAEETRFKWE